MLGTAILETKIEELDRMALDAYQEFNRQILPNKGWIVVRVLPKEQMYRGLYLPDKIQSKPIYEGIVLATWEPWTEERTWRDAEGRVFTKLIQHRSELMPGTHVLFDHWAGVPLDGDQKAHTNYRLIREDGTDRNLGGVMGLVVYDSPVSRPHEVLQQVLERALAPNQTMLRGQEDQLAALLAAQIEARFILVDREQQSVTLSGL